MLTLNSIWSWLFHFWFQFKCYGDFAWDSDTGVVEFLLQGPGGKEFLRGLLCPLPLLVFLFLDADWSTYRLVYKSCHFLRFLFGIMNGEETSLMSELKKKCKMIIRFNTYECIGNIFINLNESWFFFLLYIYYNAVDSNLRFCKVTEEWKNSGKHTVTVGSSFSTSKLETFWHLWRSMKRAVTSTSIWYIESDRRILLLICMSESWNRHCLDIIVARKFWAITKTIWL